PDGNDSGTFNSSSKILFIRLNRIGDALVSTPLIHYIKEKINSRIYVLADLKNYFALENNPDIEKVLIFRKGITGFREFFDFIKSEKIDTIIDLHDDVSATVSFLIALSRVRNKFGLEKTNKKLYTKTVPKPDPINIHIIYRILELSRLFNLEPEDAEICIRYFPKPQAMEKADKFISENFTKGSAVLGINLSAGSDARFWGIKRYKELINSLFSYKIEILILAAPKDKDKVELIGYPKYFLSESFDEFAAVISKLKVIFTPDTAAIHLAAASGVPVFGLYVHDTADKIWSPAGVDFDYVETQGHNLNNLDFEKVLLKFIPFLEKHIK
ncbi:MAG TPA: glycosyltransferase family 9 protein, partial [Ignavibacteriaceae bacterium]|nr:glycosyltransferase family 9 protein [Ignavibacteriaceae bacterium]